MNIVESIRAGRLSEARGLLVEQVKSLPGDAEARNLLFKVLLFLGEWEKAQLHLEILAAQAPEQSAQLSRYRDLITGEKRREQVRLHRQAPEFLSEPPAYLPEFMAAREELGQGRGESYSALLPVLEDALGALEGTANGEQFRGLADVDATLLPFLEVFIHDRYLWFPFTSLRELFVQPPLTLLDLLWSRARIVTWDGVASDCVVPVLYPGSASHPDDLVRLGRLTEWEELGGGYSRGVGQHLFLVGEEARGILELGEVRFKCPAAESA